MRYDKFGKIFQLYFKECEENGVVPERDADGNLIFEYRLSGQSTGGFPILTTDSELVQTLHYIYVAEYGMDDVKRRIAKLKPHRRKLINAILNSLYEYIEEEWNLFNDFLKEIHQQDKAILFASEKDLLPFGSDKFVFNYIDNNYKQATFIDTLSIVVAYVVENSFVYSLEEIYGGIMEHLMSKGDCPFSIVAFIKSLQRRIDNYGKICRFDTSCENLFSKNNAKRDGKFFLSWSHVTFADRHLILEHPLYENHVYRYPLQESRSAFNNIKRAFLYNLPPIYVESQDGEIVKVIDEPNISSCVEMIVYRTSHPKQEKTTATKGSGTNKRQVKDVLAYAKSKDSDYLNYLCDHKKNGEPIIFINENRTNSSNVASMQYEDAFLFTLSSDTLLYENALEARSSVIFRIHPLYLAEAKDAICRYFGSNKVNKRENIMSQSNEFKSAGILEYKRIMHTHDGFATWKNLIVTF